MSDEPTPGADSAPAGSVFGNLPESRPGARSPRREAGAQAKPSPRRAAAAKRATAAPKRKAEPAAKPATAAAKAAAKPRAATRPASTPPRRAEPPEPAAAEQGGGVENLAWAGVAATAEAATIGVRLANRAIAAVREAVERR